MKDDDWEKKLKEAFGYWSEYGDIINVVNEIVHDIRLQTLTYILEEFKKKI